MAKRKDPLVWGLILIVLGLDLHPRKLRHRRLGFRLAVLAGHPDHLGRRQADRRAQEQIRERRQTPAAGRPPGLRCAPAKSFSPCSSSARASS